MTFVKFMAGPVGRGVRVVAGVALIVVGLVMGSASGYVLAAVGVVALSAGALNFCLVAPLLKAPFTGRAVLRKDAGSQP